MTHPGNTSVPLHKGEGIHPAVEHFNQGVGESHGDGASPRPGVS